MKWNVARQQFILIFNLKKQFLCVIILNVDTHYDYTILYIYYSSYL